jgi:flavorubredoxin
MWQTQPTTLWLSLTYYRSPGSGSPVNAHLVRAEQPLLVDNGLPGSRTDFLQALWSQIEPADLRWIYLTHPDRHHSPATTGFYDQRTGTCFTSDCFGSPMASADQAAVDPLERLLAELEPLTPESVPSGR